MGKCVLYKILVRNLQRKRPLGKLDIDGRIFLN
jgi:hypothetical protein